MIYFCFFILIASASGAPIKPEKGVPTQNCGHEEHFVKGHTRRAHLRSDGTNVSSAWVAPHCKANPPKYFEWKSRFKANRPQEWQRKREFFKDWTEEERERMLDALSVLPDQLQISSVKGLFRSRKSSDHPENPASNFDANIVIYDKAFEARENLSRIVAHELAHILYRQVYDASKWLPFAYAAGWVPVKNPTSGKFVMVPGREVYLEADSVNTLDEDFSNSIEHYLFKADELKSKNPDIYNWIHQFYGDKFAIGKGRSR